MRSPFLRDGSELKVPGNKASVSLVLPLCWWCILSGLWVWRNVFFIAVQACWVVQGGLFISVCVRRVPFIDVFLLPMSVSYGSTSLLLLFCIVFLKMSTQLSPAGHLV